MTQLYHKSSTIVKHFRIKGRRAKRANIFPMSIGQFIHSLCVILLFLFVSCSRTNQTSSNDDTLARVRASGQIDACYVVFPPSVIKDPKTAALSGQDYDTLNMIAEKMNAKVVWHETSYGNMIADVQTRRCDVLPQCVFANIPRALSIAFTEPPNSYFGESALVRKNDPRFQNVKDPFEFDKPDITVVVAAGESGDVWVKENFKHAKVKRMDVPSSDPNRFMVEVSAGRADVAITDAVSTAFYTREHPEVLDVFHGRQFALTPTGWVVRQDDVKWLHFLETALQFLDTQGTIRQLEHKYNAPWMHLVKEYKLQ